jgi:hypothetical protein
MNQQVERWFEQQAAALAEEQQTGLAGLTAAVRSLAASQRRVAALMEEQALTQRRQARVQRIQAALQVAMQDGYRNDLQKSGKKVHSDRDVPSVLKAFLKGEDWHLPAREYEDNPGVFAASTCLPSLLLALPAPFLASLLPLRRPHSPLCLPAPSETCLPPTHHSPGHWHLPI